MFCAALPIIITLTTVRRVTRAARAFAHEWVLQADETVRSAESALRAQNFAVNATNS
jgi:hypothetical protein